MRTTAAILTPALLAALCSLAGCIVVEPGPHGYPSGAPPHGARPGGGYPGGHRDHDDHGTSGGHDSRPHTPPDSGQDFVRQSYDKGVRLGEADAMGGRSENEHRHRGEYNARYHDSFAQGYHAGYDAARRRYPNRDHRHHDDFAPSPPPY